MVFCAMRSSTYQAPVGTTDSIMSVPTNWASRWWKWQGSARRLRHTRPGSGSPRRSVAGFLLIALTSWRRCVILCRQLVGNNDLVVGELLFFSLFVVAFLPFVLVVVVVVIVIVVIVVWVIVATARGRLTIPT